MYFLLWCKCPQQERNSVVYTTYEEERLQFLEAKVRQFWPKVGISNKITVTVLQSLVVFFLFPSLINECCFSYLAVNNKPLGGELTLTGAVRWRLETFSSVQREVKGPSTAEVADASHGDCLLLTLQDLCSSVFNMLL